MDQTQIQTPGGEPELSSVDTDTSSESRETMIRRKAYELWEAEGRPDGQHERHWHDAERYYAEPSVEPAAENPGPAGVAGAVERSMAAD